MMSFNKYRKRNLKDAEKEVTLLKTKIGMLLSKIAMVEQEREFWTEQARNLQNHLQTVMRGQASMLDQMARTSMTSDDVIQCVNQVSAELREPLTQIEAAKALISMAKPDTQGTYTAVKQKNTKVLELEDE